MCYFGAYFYLFDPLVSEELLQFIFLIFMPLREDKQLGRWCSNCPGKDWTQASRGTARSADHTTTEANHDYYDHGNMANRLLPLNNLWIKE